MTEYDKLVEDNLALVHSCCKRFRGRGIEYDDLYAAGCLGLVKAAKKFRPDLGLQLSTYAVPVILGEVKRLFRDGGTVKVNRSLKELSLKINRITRSFDHEPTVGELAGCLDTTPEKITEALNAARVPISLTADSDDESRTIDLPSEDMTEKLTEKLALRDVIEQLDASDKKIIEMRYYKYLTQTQTAEILNMTQVQVSRREKKILLYMREKLSV